MRGAFPARATSDGPRHGPLGPLLGAGKTLEGASRQVDGDADDGAMLQLRGCALSTLRVIVDGRRLPPGTGAVYVNAWFDWNADGDWRDAAPSRRCGVEWGVQNLRIPRARLGPDGVAAIPIRFRAGSLPPEFWWRVQVQAEAPAAHAGGRADRRYRGGETEDFLQFTRREGDIQPPPGGLPPLRCSAPLKIESHENDAIDVTAFFTQNGVTVKNEVATFAGDTSGLHLYNTLVHPWWSVHAFLRAREHVRNPRVQKVVVRFRFDATYRGLTRRVGITCLVAIVHDSWDRPVQGTQWVRVAAPPPAPQPAECTLRADFVVDGERVPDNGFANFGVEASFPAGVRLDEIRLTDVATARRPPPDYFGAAFPWTQQVRELPGGGGGRLHLDLFVGVSDFAPDHRPAPRRATWRYEVDYVQPQGGPCDARVERS